jgi:phenylalanyl-tRNA synthetase beta chain
MNKRYGSTAEDVAKIGIEALVEKIGAQLGAVEAVEPIGDKYQGIIIVKVVSCAKHPNADKLSICLIDDGGVAQGVARDNNGHVQVVCGAPNVHEGQTVAWLPPGATVPETVGQEPFVLEARELRGVISNGMLASPKELALGDSHAGLLDIDGDYTPGTDFAEAFGLHDDIVLDIENKMFTHRPDAFGFLGVARELAGIQGLAYQSPDWYTPAPTFPDPEADALPLLIKNELPESVPRFSAITLCDVKVGPSPVWLQIELAKIGQKSINNIVDYTNFFMLQTGQPLHAYDYDKVKALSSGEWATLVVRNPKSGEKVNLLNGKTIEPRPEAIMIASDKQLIGVGGVMGGSETEVDAQTTNIILEAANFDMYSVRRTAMTHGLFTEAVTRFTKGQSPLQTVAVLAKITDEIRQFAGGKIASGLEDDNHLDKSILERNSLHRPVTVTTDFINARLGLELSAQDMRQLLVNVEFQIDIKDDELTVTAPFWRTDIELREDVVEEVGRLYGFDRLPLQLPRRDLTPAAADSLLAAKADIRNRLARAGANEVLTYSFVPGELLDKVGQDQAKAFQLANALSPELQYYRLSLLPSLLDKVRANLKAGYDEFALFELGKTHSVDQLDADKLPLELEATALVVAAADKLKKAGSAYYQARQYLEQLSIIDLDYHPLEANQNPILQPFAPGRAAQVQIRATGEALGVVGEFKSSVSRALKLPKYAAGFEIDTQVLQKALADTSQYVPLPRFPKVSQDLTLQVSAELSYQELFSFVQAELSKIQPAATLSSWSPVDIYQKSDADGRKNITLRLTIASYERTLTDAEVNKLLETAAAAAKAKFGAERL